ncbi:uncharacterized protein [Nicotiana sylvestris]|uniref:Uncharacterized protein LOC104215685 n=1 Tax=Nicotiana sylvestris TaxID=4096 RepID=A0A1U7VPN2_NICSY|nr:PREDICTED: uncharacterized protein LOC104215685 [Nicotiana sylvestris]
MALATHHLQGSYRTCPLSSSSWTTRNKLRHSVTKIHTVSQKDNFISLKCKSCLRIGAPFVLKPNGKSLKISAFKNSQNESGGRVGGSKSLKNSVKLSYVPQENEEASVESPRAQNVPISYSAEADETTSYFAIQNIFKSWLTLLRTPSPNQVMDETVEEPYTTETPERQKLVQEKERGQVRNVVWRYFLSLDATIKIPVLTFVPLYLAVTLIYGVEVSKELTPLWTLGPLIVALYVKMLRGICALYVFSFKQTVKVVRNLPTYSLLTYDYVARGKLKEDIRARLLQPLVDIKNLDYKEVAKRKAKDLEVYLVEKYLDYVESIWPYYCRTIRFLKRANLI